MQKITQKRENPQVLIKVVHSESPPPPPPPPMTATEHYFSVVLFIMLYKVVLTFVSMDEILKRDHSNESYEAVLSCGTVYYTVQGGSNF